MKKCYRCSLIKELSEFYRHNSNRDGHLGKCKDCTRLDVHKNYSDKREQYREYDKNRLRYDTSRLYSNRYNQIRARVGGFASRRYRVEGTKMLTRDEFDLWCNDNQHVFNELHKAWTQSGFIRKLAPSIDRINNSLGYTADNMQWLTFSSNSSKKDK